MINDDCYKFLKLDIVSDTDNMISVYSLYKLLNEYFEDFRILRYGNDKMINSMNNEYTFVDRIKNSMINPWFRKIFISEFNDNFIKMDDCVFSNFRIFVSDRNMLRPDCVQIFLLRNHLAESISGVFWQKFKILNVGLFA